MRREQQSANGRFNVLMTRRWSMHCALGLVMLVRWCAPAAAQTYYRWTDDRGVVHLADQPPAQSKGSVEERHLAVKPAVRQEPGDASDRDGAPHGDGAGADAGGGSAVDGPAKVIVIARHSPRVGPSALRVSGVVKNVGGKDAQQVVVNLSAVDASQGTPCLQSEASVAPSTLHPGETGNFETNVDGPCLFEDTEVAIDPVWD